ncbi:hypothetical protein Plhal304r1_c073g0161111 [Plasmopara halstedii]
MDKVCRYHAMIRLKAVSAEGLHVVRREGGGGSLEEGVEREHRDSGPHHSHRLVELCAIEERYMVCDFRKIHIMGTYFVVE